MGRSSKLAVVVLLAVLAVGCGDDGGTATNASATGAGRTDPALPTSPTDTELADAIGCSTTLDFGVDQPMVAPLRGEAASDGVACTLDGTEVHLFVRAPIGDLDDSDESYASAQGGSVENIDRLVGTGEDAGCASWVAIGETWFALASDPDVLSSIADELGGSVREIVPAAPPASYVSPGCASNS